MAVLTNTWWFDATIFFLTALRILHNYISRKYGFWEYRGIPYIKTKPFFGSIRDVIFFKSSPSELVKKFYKKMKEPYFGIWIFDEPHLVVNDPDIIDKILVKDSGSFQNRLNIDRNNADSIISKNVFLLNDSKWEENRNNFIELFSSTEKLFKSISNKTKNTVQELIRNNTLSFDTTTEELSSEILTSILVPLVFGKQTKLYDKNCPYRKKAKDINDICKGARPLFYMSCPTLARLFNVRLFKKSSFNFLGKEFNKATDAKINSNQKSDDLDSKQFLAELITFLSGGYGAVNQTISFMLYELASNEAVQIKVREEIIKATKNNDLVTLEGLEDLSYMDCCVKETLRKYPPIPYLQRICTSTYKVSENFVIDKDTPVIIPVIGLHYDEQYFQNPEKFEPERFYEKRLNNMYLPFGEGPRNCLGSKFAMNLIKLVLINILPNYKIEKTTKTPKAIKFKKMSFLLQPSKKIPIVLIKIDNKLLL